MKQHSHLHDELETWLKGQCVKCKHCLPCPEEINIPGVIDNVEYLDHFGPDEVHLRLNTLVYESRDAKASDCIECEICEERCPFEVAIIDKMHRAVEIFGV